MLEMNSREDELKNGIWIYGLAGSGKTFASKLVAKQIPSAFLIDGDIVRRHISFDLGYTKTEREIQLKRLLGLGILAFGNKLFPIISSVTMNEYIADECQKSNFLLLRIERNMRQLRAVRSLYDLEKNVVGVDQVLPNIDTDSIFNDGTDKFKKEVDDYVRSTLY